MSDANTTKPATLDIAKLKAKYGDRLVAQKITGLTFVFAAPHRADLEEYIGVVAGDTERVATKGRELCRKCYRVTFDGTSYSEDLSGLDAAFEVKPAVPLGIVKKLKELADEDEDAFFL